MKYPRRPKAPPLLSHLSPFRLLLLLLTTLPVTPQPAGPMSFLSSKF